MSPRCETCGSPWACEEATEKAGCHHRPGCFESGKPERNCDEDCSWVQDCKNPAKEGS